MHQVPDDIHPPEYVVMPPTLSMHGEAPSWPNDVAHGITLMTQKLGELACAVQFGLRMA